MYRVINAILILKDKLQHIGSYQPRTWVNKAIDEGCDLARAMNHPEVIIQSIPEDWFDFNRSLFFRILISLRKKMITEEGAFWTVVAI